MPAIQNEYDDYGYIAMRRGTAKAAPRVSDSKKRTTSAARPKATKVNPARMVATKNVNRESVRAVMRDNSRNIVSETSRKKTVSKNVNKKKIARPEEISLKKADFMRSPKQKVKMDANAIKKQHIIKNTATFLCVFSVLFLICYRSSVINESFRDLNSLKAMLTDVNTVNAQIESEIQMQTDISNIESYAKYQLGMQKPKESQIQRIVVEKEDKISTPIIIEEEKTTFLDNLVNDLLNILD